MQHPTPTKITTLCLAYKHPKILLGLKKRGFGEGRWNGYGGKVEKGETLEENVVREMQEECGITPTKFENRGVMYFEFSEIPDQVYEVNLFLIEEYIGEPVETEEMKPQWFGVSDLPWDKMWDDDRIWYLLFLEGKKFEGNFLFDGNEKVIRHEIEVI
ncbi:MAG: 8-oxo-dGTP diphosphatase [Candidatus Moranbacteria bacterium]|nr:8-oxo-dGTP diphosphatase [Candidatus Moranbacteria bacterium]